MSTLDDLGGDRVNEMNTWIMLPEGISCSFCCFFTKRYISFVYFYSRQKHLCGIMTYQLMPRMLPRPNMNFYLAWKKRSLQEWVSSIYYYCVQKKKNLLSHSGKFCRSFSFNDPMRLTRCTMLPFASTGSCWFGPRKWQWFPLLPLLYPCLSFWLMWATMMW